jgi:hypothetical protein
MSYCRFSSNDFQCDLYIYGDVQGGITIHVSASRYVFAKPLPPSLEYPGPDTPKDEVYAWAKKEADRMVAVMAMLDHKTMVPIELPYAGQSFYGLSGVEAVVKVRALKKLGYRVPGGVIEALEEDRNVINSPPEH